MTPEQRRLFEIFHPYAAEQQAGVFSSGGRFVYYTRAETAVSILKNGQIWMRKCTCMNDYSEVQYGLRCLFDAYNNNAAGQRFQSVLESLFPGLVQKIGKLFDSWRWSLQTDTYFTCVSEHKSDEDVLGRLSMWRAYGGENGVALVINNAAFQSEVPSEVLKIYSSPVASSIPTGSLSSLTGSSPMLRMRPSS